MLGGIVLIVSAAGLVELWRRGLLNDAIASITTAAKGVPEDKVRPIAHPFASASHIGDQWERGN